MVSTVGSDLAVGSAYTYSLVMPAHETQTYRSNPIFQAGRVWATTTPLGPLSDGGPNASVTQALKTLSTISRGTRDYVNDMIELGVVPDTQGLQKSLDQLRGRIVNAIEQDLPSQPVFAELSGNVQHDPRAFAAAVVTAVEEKFAKADNDVPAFRVDTFEGDLERQAAKLVSEGIPTWTDERVARVSTLNMATVGSDVEVFAQGAFNAAALDLGRSTEGPTR